MSDAAACEPVDAAITELRSLRSHDPCASNLMATIKATVHTLERYWGGEVPPEAGPESVVV